MEHIIRLGSKIFLCAFAREISFGSPYPYIPGICPGVLGAAGCRQDGGNGERGRADRSDHVF